MPTLNITKKEAVDLFNNLHSVGNLSGSRFVYVIAKNISLLQDEIKALNKAQEPSEAFIEFDNKRIELAEKFSEKEENGDPKIIRDKGQSRFVIKDIKAFEKAVDELKKSNADVVEDREKQLEDFNNILNEEFEIHLLGLNQEDLPENITSSQLVSIFSLMIDLEENK